MSKAPMPPAVVDPQAVGRGVEVEVTGLQRAAVHPRRGVARRGAEIDVGEVGNVGDVRRDRPHVGDVVGHRADVSDVTGDGRDVVLDRDQRVDVRHELVALGRVEEVGLEGSVELLLLVLRDLGQLVVGVLEHLGRDRAPVLEIDLLRDRHVARDASAARRRGDHHRDLPPLALPRRR